MSTPRGKPPAAVPVLGVAAVIVAMLTLCGGGLRMINPDGVIGAAALEPAFEAAAARNLFYVSIGVWMLLAVALAVAGGALLAGLRWGRWLALVYAWTAVVSAIVVTVLGVAFAMPALDESGLTTVEAMRTVLAGPLTGCCPVVFAIVLLGFLYNDAVAAWAKSPKV